MTNNAGNRELRGRKLVVLVVDDESRRIEILRGWTPDDVRLLWVSSAGMALATLQRDRGRAYAGIMLDHDLWTAARTDADLKLDGRDVVAAVIEHVDIDVPVLVHSMNPGYAPIMVRRLEAAAFPVTRRPFDTLTRVLFDEWLAEVRELASDDDD